MNDKVTSLGLSIKMAMLVLFFCSFLSQILQRILSLIFYDQNSRH